MDPLSEVKLACRCLGGWSVTKQRLILFLSAPDLYAVGACIACLFCGRMQCNISVPTNLVSRRPVKGIVCFSDNRFEGMSVHT